MANGSNMSNMSEKIVLNSNHLFKDSIEYAIQHKTIWATQITRKKRPLFVIDQNEVRVEEFATYILEQNGYKVFKGEDVHFFISILSLNFLDSYFLQVFHNWVGSSAQSHINRLSTLCIELDSKGEEHILSGESAVLAYYSQYTPKKRIYQELTKRLINMDRDFLYRLTNMYKRMGYTTKGAPDLVAFAKTNPWFIEVKSQTDSLSPEQYKYFEDFLTSVGKNILVLRVLPENSSIAT